MKHESIADQLTSTACHKGNAAAIKEVQRYAMGLTSEGRARLMEAIKDCEPRNVAMGMAVVQNDTIPKDEIWFTRGGVVVEKLKLVDKSA